MAYYESGLRASVSCGETGRGMTSRAIPKQTSRWDEHRNTSQVFPVPPDALPTALRALEQFKRGNPELYAWVAEGAPAMTEAEHLARFGEPYRTTRTRRA